MTRKRRRWTTEDDRILRELFPTNPTRIAAERLGRSTQATSQRASLLGLEKDPEYLRTQACRFRPGNQSGQQFKPGHRAWNKGRKGVSGHHPNTRRTQFRKGQLSGAAARNYKPVGTLRINHDGCLEQKVTDDHPVPARRWVSVHRLVWEAANGPVPKGHLVVFKPGRQTTDPDRITLDRLELITRAENMRRNSFLTRYPKDVADLIRMRGVLNRKIRSQEASQ